MKGWMNWMIRIKIAKEQPIENDKYWSYPFEEIEHIYENAEDGDMYLYYQGRLYEAPYVKADDNYISVTGYFSSLVEKHFRSSTYRDYGPSNPWDAPGMSIKDFL